MNLVNATRMHNATTANGAVTHSTSLSACLDLFFIAGASRRMSDLDIISLFVAARAENRLVAYKILFWARDCRGGAGEKRFFKILMKYVRQYHLDEYGQMIIHTPTYGTWKDIFELDSPETEVLQWLETKLQEDPNANLLAKWFPRKGPWFVAMHKYLGISPKEFRKQLVAMTTVVETKMCNREWSLIDYSKVPSVAMNTYRNTFGRQDGERYNRYIADVHAGKTKINASVLFPHQLYQAIENGEDVKAVEAQWNNLPDYMINSTERILPVCDVSGSMDGLPMDVSVSLGIYISERNKGIFKDAFITFSESPEMNYLKGSLSEKMRQLQRANWGMNTNLQAVFSLILNSALRHSLPETEMPTKLLIISDMEFDKAVEGSTNFEAIKASYNQAGYKIPDVVFWNVNGRRGNVPATTADKNVGLVSGFSPAILTSILKGEIYSPEQLMLDTINSKRYSAIKLD